MGAFDALLREAMLVTTLLCIPILALAATAGVAVAIVQAATQVQEQTLTLLPKLVVVGLLLVVFGGAGMHALERLFADAIALIPALVTDA